MLYFNINFFGQIGWVLMTVKTKQNFISPECEMIKWCILDVNHWSVTLSWLISLVELSISLSLGCCGWKDGWLEKVLWGAGKMYQLHWTSSQWPMRAQYCCHVTCSRPIRSQHCCFHSQPRYYQNMSRKERKKSRPHLSAVWVVSSWNDKCNTQHRAKFLLLLYKCIKYFSSSLLFLERAL